LAAAGWVAALVLCRPAQAFQAPVPDDVVTVLPRSRLPDPLQDQPVVRVESALVSIPVRVTTAGGASVTSLHKEDFRLFEDNVEQAIAHFAMDDAPVSIGLLFDVSGSMHNKIRKSSEAVAEFIKTANPADEFFLIRFNERAKMSVPFTTDADLLYRQVLHSAPFGQTALLDAIHLGLAQMKKARNPRKALVIVSDGGDNSSRHSVREIRNALMESDVQGFAMGIFDANYLIRHTAEERRGPLLLDDLAEETGGRHFPVENLNDLPVISAQISREMRNQYVLGYYSTNSVRDGKYRRVKLTLIGRVAGSLHSLHTDYRRGYYASGR